MRQLGGISGLVVKVISVVMTLYLIGYFSGIFFKVGLNIMPVPHRATCLACVLLLGFLLYPARKGAPVDKLPWYDVLLGISGLAPTLYVVFFYDTILEHSGMGVSTTAEVVLGFLLMALVLEATRRIVGWAMPIVAVFFIVHPIYSNLFPGIFEGHEAGSKK